MDESSDPVWISTASVHMSLTAFGTSSNIMHRSSELVGTFLTPVVGSLASVYFSAASMDKTSARVDKFLASVDMFLESEVKVLASVSTELVSSFMG